MKATVIATKFIVLNVVHFWHIWYE